MNVPEIRFKEFKENWDNPIIDSIFELRNGYTPSKSIKEYWENGTIPWYRMEDIRAKGNILSEAFQYITPLAIKGSGLFKPYSIILATTATIGVHAMVIADSLANQRFTNFSIRKSLLNKYMPEFVNHAFYKIDRWSEKNTNSGGLLSVDVKSLLKEPFYTPYYNEQQKIASYFQSLDSLIQTTSKELASLKQIKAASLQSMFPQEGETVPKVRFKGFEGEWDKVKLSTLGQTYSGLTGKTKEDFNFGDSLYIPFLNVLLNPQIDESNLQKVRVENNEKQNEIHKGDILFNTSSETPEEVGLCSVFMSDIKKVYLNSFCFGFRLFNNLVDPSYIVYLLRSQIGRKLMLVLAQGATRYNLSKKSFLNAHIIIPTSQQEQQKIASYFCNLDKQLSLQAQRLEKLKQIKAACLDKMFV